MNEINEKRNQIEKNIFEACDLLVFDVKQNVAFNQKTERILAEQQKAEHLLMKKLHSGSR